MLAPGPPKGPPINVTFVHADSPAEWNSANWRSIIPAQALNRTRWHHAKVLGIQDFSLHLPVAEYHCNDAEVIVLQRGAMPQAWPAVEHWREKGKAIVSDIDDGYIQIGPEHVAFNFWHRGITAGPNGQPVRMPRPAILDMADGLRRVQGLTAPNQLILDDWGKQTGVKTALVPNYPDLRAYQAKRTRSPSDDNLTWVSWGGSAGHLQSFTQSGILYALSRVLSARPLTRLIYCGSDLRVLEALPLKPGQKEHFNWRRYADWPALVANFDIALIPAAGDFDARRSQIKPLECSLMGVPWIASKTAAYDGLDEYGVLVDNTPDAWAGALIELLEHGSDPQRLAHARKWALAQDIDDHVDEIVKAYRSFGK